MDFRNRFDDRPLAAAVLGGSVVFLSVYVAGSAISFGVHLLIARHFGATAYGHFAYAISWMSILLLGCSMGLKPTIIRFSAQYAAQDQWALLRGLLRTAVRWTLVASAIVLAASATALMIVRPKLDDMGWTLLLVGASMPFMAIGDVFSSATRGLGAVTRSQIPSSIGQHAVFALLLSGAIAFHYEGSGGTTAAAAFFGATCATMMVSGWLLRNEIARVSTPLDPSYAIGPWWDAAGANVLIAFFQAMRSPAIVVVLATYVPTEHIAYFVAAQRLAGIASLGLIGVTGFASPLISRYFALGEPRSLQRLAHISARGSIVCAGATVAVLCNFGEALLHWFGTAFAAAYIPLLILLAGEMAAAAVGPVGHFLAMTGVQRTASYIESISSMGALALACVLIPTHGITGAATAIASGSLLRNLWMAIVLWQRIGVRCTPV